VVNHLGFVVRRNSIIENIPFTDGLWFRLYVSQLSGEPDIEVGQIGNGFTVVREALIVLLLWIFYSAQIFLLGAEFTRAWARVWGSRSS
jgi:hypothetical protein